MAPANSSVKEFMATKLWENPPKAHLRGAVALINDQKSKKQQVSVSPALKQAVQTQIVSYVRSIRSYHAANTTSIDKQYSRSQ